MVFMILAFYLETTIFFEDVAKQFVAEALPQNDNDKKLNSCIK